MTNHLKTLGMRKSNAATTVMTAKRPQKLSRLSLSAQMVVAAQNLHKREPLFPKAAVAKERVVTPRAPRTNALKRSAAALTSVSANQQLTLQFLIWRRKSQPLVIASPVVDATGLVRTNAPVAAVARCQRRGCLWSKMTAVVIAKPKLKRARVLTTAVKVRVK
jgi:hypothetical protein